MNSNQVFQKFQRNHRQIVQFYQKITSETEQLPEQFQESLEELTVAIEELNVAQEELLQQNQEIEQSRTQIELQRQRYQDLFELAPDGYIVTDQAGNIRQANRAASELLNVPQMYLETKPLVIFVPPSERSLFRSLLYQLVTGPTKLPEWELRFKPRNGNIFTAAITVSNILSEENHNGEWLWLIRDISDRKKAEMNLRKMQIAETSNRILIQELRVQQRLETALRESESRFRYIFEAVGVSIWEEDFSQVRAALDGLQEQGIEDLRQYFTEHPKFVEEAVSRIQVLDVNSQTLKMLEAESKEQVLNSLPAIFLPETFEFFKEQLLEMAANQTFYSGETVVQTFQGKILYLLITVRYHSDLEPSGPVIVTLLDISEAKQREAERQQAELLLQEQAQDLQQLNQSLVQTSQLLTERNQELDRFVYVVSHDLKAPLRAITNLSTWLADDLYNQLTEDNLNYIQLLQQRVQRMEDLIDGLLVYSRVGRSEINSQKVDVGELLEEILDSLDPPAAFNIVKPDNAPTIYAKRLLLSQVLSNLISNAIKHHNRPNGQIEILAINCGDHYEFTVRDDGPGIAPENYQRVFEIFQTLKASENRENTGIGLAIVKKILEAEGGRIWLESELGKGTSFYFTWPNHD